MFDNLQTIIAGFSGKLKESPTLHKWFWVFVAAQLFTLIVLWYNSFMSLNFYQKMLERFADMQGDFLPYLVTISIALIAYFLISSITATILDYLAGRKYKTEGHEPMFIAAIIGLIALLGLDIYANLQGVDFVAYNTTTEVMANPLDNLGAEFEARRKNAEEAYKPDIQKLEKQIAAIKNTRKASQKGHNRHCKSTCPYKPGTGAVHWNGAITPYGSRLIADLQTKIEGLASEYKAELAAIRSEQATKTEAAKDDYSRDKSRFDVSVTDKQSGHRKLVYFAYALAILLSFVSNHYADRATFAVSPDREAELIAAFETQEARVEAMKAAQRAKYQYGNEGTQQVLQQILAQMEGGHYQQMPRAKEPIPHLDKDQIGFRQVKPEHLEPERLDNLLRKSEDRILSMWEKIEERLDDWEKGKVGPLSPKEKGDINPDPLNYISDPSPVPVYESEKHAPRRSHPKFSKDTQPQKYRKGLHPEKYARFLFVARLNLERDGKFSQKYIVGQTGFSPKSVRKYFQFAVEKGDLQA